MRPSRSTFEAAFAAEAEVLRCLAMGTPPFDDSLSEVYTASLTE